VWLDRLFTNDWAQDVVAIALTFGVALTWLRAVDALAARGVIEQRLSRKIIHIGTGPLFLLCWNFFSAQFAARFLAALVPLAITAQFLLVGTGVIRDPAAVQAMSRTGDRREILRGPLYYGLVFVACTLLFWRTEVPGAIALMVLCGGDGLADLVGRRYGRARLPFSPGKSWAGSAAMLAGGFLLAWALVALFQAEGYLLPGASVSFVLPRLALACAAATVVEALPFPDIDNLTTTAAAVLVSLVVL
jgi:phytol kinase